MGLPPLANLHIVISRCFGDTAGREVKGGMRDTIDIEHYAKCSFLKHPLNPAYPLKMNVWGQNGACLYLAFNSMHVYAFMGNNCECGSE